MILFLLVLFSGLFPIRVFAADPMEIKQLIEKAKMYDGRSVAVTGEVIGESIPRAGYSWVNIKDESDAIGIWMKTTEAKRITYYGNYKNKGDTAAVVGIFHRACAEHGGESDIHCETLKIVEKGSPVIVRISAGKIILVTVLFLMLISELIILYHTVIRKKIREQ